MIWTTQFWKGAGERAIKTFAQTAVAFIVVGTTGLLDLDYGNLAAIAGAAALASVLTSIGNADFVAGTTITYHVASDDEAATDITKEG